MKKQFQYFLISFTLLLAVRPGVGIAQISKQNVADTIAINLQDNTIRAIKPYHFQRTFLNLLNFADQKVDSYLGDSSTVIGSDENNNAARTNAVTKKVRLASPHFYASYLPVSMLYTYNTAAHSVLNVGGGTERNNAATHIDFWTGAAVNSGLGTHAGRFHPSGNLTLGSLTDAGYGFDVYRTSRFRQTLTADVDAYINGLTVGRGAGTVETNTAIGLQALSLNTGGTNTAVGYMAARTNTTGYGNTAVGWFSFEDNFFGIHNTAVGASSLSYNISGDHNTALGVYALGRNTTGSSNVAVGKEAGRFLGNLAGNDNSANSVYLGEKTKSGAANSINEIVIGQSATGLGSNSAVIGNSSTLFTRLNGNVGIGTSSNAGYGIDVAGTARIQGVLNSNGVAPISDNTHTAGSSNFRFSQIWSTRGSIGDAASLESSAALQVNSTTRGILPPRMTTTQGDAISSPAEGLEHYDLTTKVPRFYNGTAWSNVVDEKSNQTIAGTKTFTGIVKINSNSDGGLEIQRLGSNIGYFGQNNGGSILEMRHISTVVNNRLRGYGNSELNALHGNTLIGSTTDSGEKLQVTGTSKFTGLASLQTGAKISNGGELLHYNTSDETTNYERVRGYWIGNTYRLWTEANGTGTTRNIDIYSGTNTRLSINAFSGVNASRTGSHSNTFSVSGVLNASGIPQSFNSTIGTVNQSGTASYKGSWVSIYEQSVGSGEKLIIDYGLNTATDGTGTHTSLFKVDNTGLVTTRNIEPSANDTYRVGGANNYWSSAYIRTVVGPNNTHLRLSSQGSYGIAFQSGSGTTTNGLVFPTTGNWYIGSTPTDAGYKLDVAGTARVQGAFLTTADIFINGFVIGSNGIGSNTLLGSGTGYTNVTGTHNTFVGNLSGGANTTGEFNTFIGQSASVSNTTGNSNTVIGRSALLHQSTGHNNVVIGVNAARWLQDGTTPLSVASTSIYIGNSTKSNSNSQSNQIVIGNDAIGLGTNTTVLGNSSTTFSRIFGKIAIGTSVNAGYDLDVAGTTRIQGVLTVGNGTSGQVNIGDAVLSKAAGSGFALNSSISASGSFNSFGSLTADASAVVSVNSTTKGFLPPRMTTAQRDAIASPAEGLMVYVTDSTKGWFGYNGTVWEKLNN